MQQQQGGSAAPNPGAATGAGAAATEATKTATPTATSAGTAAAPQDPARNNAGPASQGWNAAAAGRLNERLPPGIAAAQAPGNPASGAARPAGASTTTTGTAASGSSPATQLGNTPAAAAKPAPSAAGAPRPAAPPAAAATTNTNLRPLNVKDALSYLDQVKSKYKYSPEVYNAFLDVMKDFKTQVIDTPGVIDRVSSLFRNCPILIANFNLFLPDGYRIEAVVQPKDPEYIDTYRVVTPYTVQQLQAGQSTSLTGVILPGQVKRYQQQAQARVGGAAAQGTAAQQASAAATTSSVQKAAAGAAASQPAAARRAQEAAAPAQAAAAANAGAGAGRGKPAPNTTAAAPPQDVPVKQEPTTSGIPAANKAAASQPQTASNAPAASSAQQQADARMAYNRPAAAPAKNEQDAPAQQAASIPASQAASAQPSRTATPGAASALSNSTDSRRPPIEFNHAISYVNKIKNRFIREPEVYKTFLDILQTYQKEQRPIQDVYAQVTKLFKAAPDLLEEFKQFLPDHSAQGQAEAAAAAQAKAAAQARAAGAQGAAALPAGARSTGQPAAGGPVRQIPPEEPAAAAAAQKRKRAAGGQVDKLPDALPQAGVQGGLVAGKGKQQPGRKVGKGAAAGVKDPVVAAQQSNARYEGLVSAQPAYPQPILSYLPPGYTLPGFGGTASVSQGPPPTSQMTNEERLFFDRVADFIDDKFTYYEFLKLLNLYTQDIIDLPTLVSRAWLFIGSAPDLWLDFRHLVGWQDGSSVNGRTIENGEWIVENIPAVERKGPDLSKAESAGPSYRKLPPSEIHMQCSGRDKLCWEVLNDEWVSVMSLGSEEVFLAHRKNPFEEALHRSEEERHEYDFHIEANLRTIALLEPIAAKIATMTPKERETFRLKPGLGGQSKSLYQRIIKKVYGKEIGREVIAALHENPCVSVPIVLARLKQKDEEWKRALREWNRVWREVDAKNFYRSLDHQGITFKAQDKRYINPKSLVMEIEVLRRTEMQKQIAAPLPYRPPAATYQLAYPISDETVLFDSLKLFLSYLDRAPGYHTLAERDRIEAFLRSLTSLVFAIPVSVLDAMLTPVQDDDRSGSMSEDDMSDSAASSADGHGSLQPNGRRAGSVTGGVSGRKNGDLRKKALKNAGHGDPAAIDKKTAKNGVDGAEITPATSRDATPVPSNQPAAGTAADSANEDTAMAGAESEVAVETAPIVEQEANGDSSFKTDVPTSAAGLEGMSGVETVKTAVASTTDSIEQAQHPRQPSTAPVIPPDAPPETMQTAHDVVENGPIVPAANAGASPTDDTAQQAGPSTPVLHNAQRDGQHQIRRFNFFCNTPYYCAIRLLQLLYSRLDTMKQAAKALESTKSASALANTAYTTFGKANPRFSGQEAPTSEFIYDSMLELCEKLFGSEIDQPTFEDGIRALFGNQAYHIFTIDKLLSSLVKTVWSLIDSNRETYAANGEIFKLLVDDRRYPTTAQAQQVSYRINAELAAGSDEHLYRIEWLPRRHQLTFQLLGKDEILPEDEGDLSKAWERYIESFVGDTVTKGIPLSEKELLSAVCLERNLKATKEAASVDKTQLFAKSELESRICMRSYRMFWQGETEDSMHREWPEVLEAGKLEETENQRKNRFARWLEKRNATLLEQQAAKEKIMGESGKEPEHAKEAEKKDEPGTAADETGDVTMEDSTSSTNAPAKPDDKEAEKKDETGAPAGTEKTDAVAPTPALGQSSA